HQYLHSFPTRRSSDLEKWLANYHTKLEFLETEARARGRILQVPNDEIVFCHDIRNSQYHAGGPGIPEAEHLALLKKAALDVFSIDRKSTRLNSSHVAS